MQFVYHIKCYFTLLKFSRWFEPVFGATVAAVIKWWNLVLTLGAMVQHNSKCWNEISLTYGRSYCSTKLDLNQHKILYNFTNSTELEALRNRIIFPMKHLINYVVLGWNHHSLYAWEDEPVWHLWKIYTSQHRHSQICSCYNLWKKSRIG